MERRKKIIAIGSAIAATAVAVAVCVAVVPLVADPDPSSPVMESSLEVFDKKGGEAEEMQVARSNADEGSSGNQDSSLEASSKSELLELIRQSSSGEEGGLSADALPEGESTVVGGGDSGQASDSGSNQGQVGNSEEDAEGDASGEGGMSLSEDSSGIQWGPIL